MIVGLLAQLVDGSLCMGYGASSSLLVLHCRIAPDPLLCRGCVVGAWLRGFEGCLLVKVQRFHRCGWAAVGSLEACGQHAAPSLEALVRDAERRAGRARRTMTEHEGLPAYEAVNWCGSGITVRATYLPTYLPIRPAGWPAFWVVKLAAVPTLTRQRRAGL
jgi:hypothetical protein